MTRFQQKTRKSNYDIMREQHLFEQKRIYLRQLFKQLDINGDNVVTKDEIVQYLIGTLNMEQATAEQSAEAIFSEIDENNDQSLQIDEFADNYIEIVRKVRIKQIGYEEQMIQGYEDFKNHQKLIKRKLQEKNTVFRVGSPDF